MEKVDITIIGAGVAGLAIAAQIARPELNIIILEKNAAHGGGISSRNSEVIHGGMYYPQGSLKAVLCVEGRGLLYDIAARNNIPHKKTGKLIVAINSPETEELERLQANAVNNDVHSTRMMTKREIAAMEPNIAAINALYSPQTGIISAHDLMNYYLATAAGKKAHIVYNTSVTGLEKQADGYLVVTNGSRGEKFEFSSGVVINCAGLQSDTIANMLGCRYLLHYCKGDYCGISGIKRGTVRHLIYPVPEKNHTGLGVHLTIDLNGRMKLGPDTEYIERAEDYRVAPDKANRFYQSAGKFLPFLKAENISPDMAGIRPKLQGPGDAFCDFVIKEEFPGFINLVGIESPGLTASPAIARMVEKFLF